MSLVTLPNEMLLEIAHYSTIGDLYTLLRTSKRLYDLLFASLYQRSMNDMDVREQCVLWASRRGVLETLQRAHSYGASLDINRLIDFQRRNDIYPSVSTIATPVYLAVRGDHLAVVQFLLENGADVHTEVGVDFVDITCDCYFSISPLHEAIVHQEENDEIVALLITHGACSIWQVSKALKALVYRGNLELVKLLLNTLEGEVVHIVEGEPQQTALYAAIACNNISMANLLLDFSMLEAYEEDKDGKSILHIAAQYGSPEMMTILLERAGDESRLLDSEDSHGEVPIHSGVRRGNLQIIKMLLEANGSSKDVLNNAGHDCLDIATECDSVEVFAYFLEVYKATDKRDGLWGGSLTQSAITHAQWGNLQLLIEHRAEIERCSAQIAAAKLMVHHQQPRLDDGHEIRLKIFKTLLAANLLA